MVSTFRLCIRIEWKYPLGAKYAFQTEEEITKLTSSHFEIN